MIRLKTLLHEMNWKEAKQYFAENDLAIVPVGSNEQHGPPNPLGTDHLIAKGIAEEVAKRTGVARAQSNMLHFPILSTLLESLLRGEKCYKRDHVKKIL